MVLLVNKAECTQVEKKSDKKEVYVLTVLWKNGPQTVITRTYMDFFDCTNKLKASAKKKKLKSVNVPSLPALRWFQKFGNATEKRKTQVNEFCKAIINLENHDSGHELEGDIEQLFKASMVDIALPDLTAAVSESKDKTKVKDDEKDKVKDKVKDKKEKEKKKKDKKQEKEEKSKKNDVNDAQLDELKHVLKNHDKEPSTESDTNSQHNSEPDINDQYIVSTDFLEPEDGQIALHKEQVVEVLERSLTGWWFVFCEETSSEGWAPASILEPLDPYSEAVIKPPKMVSHSLKQTFSAVNDYTASKPDELTYKHGDKLQVLEMSLDGWWTAKCGGKTGLVCATNLRICSDTTMDDDTSELYATCGLYQQHSIYTKKPPPRRDPSICLSELYSQVQKPAISSRMRPQPISRPHPLAEEDEEEEEEPEYVECPPPALPARSGADARYSEIVFDDDKPGVPRTVHISNENKTVYSEIVLDSPTTPTSPTKPAPLPQTNIHQSAGGAENNKQVHSRSPRESKPDQSSVGEEKRKQVHSRPVPRESNLGQSSAGEHKKQGHTRPPPPQPEKDNIKQIANPVYENKPTMHSRSTPDQASKPSPNPIYENKKPVHSRPQPVQQHSKPVQDPSDEKRTLTPSRFAPVSKPNQNSKPAQSAPPKTPEIPKTNQEPKPRIPQKALSLQFFRVNEDSNDGEGLAVVIGDIVMKRRELDDLIHCDLCKSESNRTRNGKGWLKRSILTPVKCEVLDRGEGNSSPTVKCHSPPAPAPRTHIANGNTSPHIHTSNSKPDLMPRPTPPHHTTTPTTTTTTSTPTESNKDLCKYAWYAGAMDRESCAEYMATAKDGQYIIRSTKGEYSLSVMSENRIRHFQIRRIDNGKYTIGGHDFAELKGVIKFYKTHPIFYVDEKNKDGRSLGEPFIALK